MQTSAEINELATALVAAQKAFSPAVKAKANPAFKGALYVDLASAIDAAQPALLENGLAVLQGASGDITKQSITVTTRIIHTSGQWLEDCLTLPATNRGEYTAQSAGSALTYCRRYSYMAILGFAPEDDDGNAASAPRSQQAPAQQQIPSAQRPVASTSAKISEPQSKRFFALSKAGQKSNDDIRKYLMDICHCEKSLDMSREKYDAACKWAEGLVEFQYKPDSAEITDDDIPF
jgi:hypothetical protein